MIAHHVAARRFLLAVFLVLAVASAPATASADPCLKDSGSCKDAPTLTLPACDAETLKAVVDLETALGRGVDGKPVVVRAPLQRGGVVCTELACRPGTCCNECGAALALSSRPVTGLPGEVGALTLLGEVDGQAMGCGGDDSMVCCPLPAAGEEVVATGTVVSTGFSIAGPSFGLKVTAMCAP